MTIYWFFASLTSIEIWSILVNLIQSVLCCASPFPSQSLFWLDCRNFHCEDSFATIFHQIRKQAHGSFVLLSIVQLWALHLWPFVCPQLCEWRSQLDLIQQSLIFYILLCWDIFCDAGTIEKGTVAKKEWKYTENSLWTNE